MERNHNKTTVYSVVPVSTIMSLQWRNTFGKKNDGTLGNAHMKTHTIVTAIAINNRSRSILYCNILIAILAFAIGSFIYLAFNPTDLLLYDWFGIDAEADWIQNIRKVTLTWNIPRWIRWNLSDSLWLFSYLLLNDSIWGKEDRCLKNIFGLSMLFLAIVSELLQARNIIPGCGDWYDVLAYIISYTIYKSFKLYEKKY